MIQSFKYLESNYQTVTIKEVSETDIKNAQDELLHAKAQYALRNAIVESTLMANPVLKAVHAGEKASIIERLETQACLICGYLPKVVIFFL